MKINRQNVAEYLKNMDFTLLFIDELGWDYADTATLPVKLTEDDDETYSFSPIAHKRGMIVYLYQDTDKTFPDYPSRRKLERKVAKSAHEHIIIFLDKTSESESSNSKTGECLQIWQWVKIEAGKPSACREHRVYEAHSGEALIQKLEQIAFSLAEEEELTLLDVTGRSQKAFDMERVTKKFYDRFKTEHDNFLDFISGIPDGDDEKWYASIMMNRLMFTYFIQKKGFLDGDVDYLRNRLEMVQSSGKDKFYSFYRSFLGQLFHEGLDKKKADRSTAINLLIGDIPYLNGGIFHLHEMEEKYHDIDIDDDAFSKIFAFFDEYDWHLDERPLHNDKEINPDVLGYIFEKYINQKQMGAYYTKEDITGYIGRNTIIPRLLDMAKEKCKIAFEGEHTIWELLHENPDRYIYPPVRHGISYDIHESKELANPLDLPDNIQIGVNTTAPGLLERRKDWNNSAPAEYALPTEIWREVVARRERYEGIWLKLAGKEIIDINDLITYNLDICQFAQDVIESSEGPELVRAFYRSIEKITILDPTCGSGAFLFAALNILEPLYEACLDRMQLFIDDLDNSDEKHRSDKYSDFRDILADVAKHPSPRYFIYKSIILNNLYGVDIMDEAIEICKLRLFLKLMAQVECDRAKENMGVEALPDVDFNIRAGNSLVGFANYEEVKQAVEKKGDILLDYGTVMPKIDEKAETVDHAFKLFRTMQTQQDISSAKFSDAKQELRKRLFELEDELNGYLAKQYGKDKSNQDEYDIWLNSHKPFHWYVDFYGIIHGNKGFDVIIGNPPYVNFKKIDYDIHPMTYICNACHDLFAITIERSFCIQKNSGRNGFIIPLSAFSTSTMVTLKNTVFNNVELTWNSYYSASDQPASLFNGVRHRLLITMNKVAQGNKGTKFSTNFLKWFSNERSFLFPSRINYVNLTDNAVLENSKISSLLEVSILKKLNKDKLLANYLHPCVIPVYYHNAPVHWGKIFDFIPYYSVAGEQQQSSHLKSICLSSNKFSATVICLLSSSLFYWFNWQYSNCRDLSKKDISSMPIELDVIDETLSRELFDAKNDLMRDLKKNSKIYHRQSKGIFSEFDSFYPLYSKTILDYIDTLFSGHYGFTDEELDYIINYDIKYRMGKELKG
jgi:Eco57I restriction-modification methylase